MMTPARSVRGLGAGFGAAAGLWQTVTLPCVASTLPQGGWRAGAGPDSDPLTRG